ncbi:MAG TPA: hypothetical protein VM115_10175 [Vicinamibacterales bacterium]|nr:hypothetical protein [Vicinamibacterales bacterium]
MGSKTDLKLWAGILAGPIAWIAQLALVYPIAQLTCHSGFAPQHPGMIHLISSAALAVTVLGLMASWPLRGESSAQRERFMANLGLLIGALFALVVIATWSPVFLMMNCES